MAKVKESTLQIWDYICAHEDEDITAKDIATALNIDDVRKVNGTLTAALLRHREEINGEKVIVPLIERVEGELEIETEDGKIKHENVKFIKRTEAGKTFQFDAE